MFVNNGGASTERLQNVQWQERASNYRRHCRERHKGVGGEHALMFEATMWTCHVFLAYIFKQCNVVPGIQFHIQL